MLKTLPGNTAVNFDSIDVIRTEAEKPSKCHGGFPVILKLVFY